MAKVENVGRKDIAREAGIETLKNTTLTITSEMIPWLEEDMPINTVEVKLASGQVVRYGSAMTERATKILEDDWNIKFRDGVQIEDSNRENIEDRMNRGLWTSISNIIDGKAQRVGRFIDCPIPSYYVKDDSTKARLFFASLGNIDGLPTFVRIGSTFTVPGEKKFMTHVTKLKQGTK